MAKEGLPENMLSDRCGDEVGAAGRCLTGLEGSDMWGKGIPHRGHNKHPKVQTHLQKDWCCLKRVAGRRGVHSCRRRGSRSKGGGPCKFL